MTVMAVVFGVVAGVVHLGFWLMESIRWRQPAIWKRFGVSSQDEADALAFAMQNQGYYNLFLAIGAIAGAVLVSTDIAGRTTLLGYCSLFMLGAAVVLFVARRTMVQAALVQGVPPAFALLALALIS
jgi:putative membrane protein